MFPFINGTAKPLGSTGHKHHSPPCKACSSPGAGRLASGDVNTYIAIEHGQNSVFAHEFDDFP